MPVQDIFLPLASHLRPSADALGTCAAIARSLGAHVAVVAVDTAIAAAAHPFQAASHFVRDATLTPERSSADPDSALNLFLAEARRRSVRCEHAVIRGTIDTAPAMLAEAARLHDLTLLPVGSHDSALEQTQLALLFSSGRPLLIFPQEQAAALPITFDRVAIAWNRSAQAARAVGDALPLLRTATHVQIFTATDRATEQDAASGNALVRHLGEHGIAATFETIALAGSSVGKVFESYVKANASDLLVMGGYGRSWLKEFTWGGATNTILEGPPCWVLMSH
ncbi:universal stress protein [Bradyrhizobium sp. 2TAF24]|uniref:universal stress protein n=1 Tax=Bradyrhizobium sp. 2TAF24 TaxID=3233011 RepID=UPI003F8DD074